MDKLKQILSLQTTIFSRRYNCLKTKKNDNDDFVTYAGIVNRNCEDFQFTELGPEQFKCLVFISGLQATKDFEIRARLLRKLETHSTDNPVTLHDLVNECQRIVSLKMDTALVEKPAQSNVHKVERKKQGFSKSAKDKLQSKASGIPKFPCWNCGCMHYAKYCDYLKHECSTCKKIGHKEGYCNSARKPKINTKSEKKSEKKLDDQRTAKSNVVISVNQIQFQNKRKFITVKIDEQEVKLQIDTASDITLISQETWQLLGKPTTKVSSMSAYNASGDPLEIIQEMECDVTLNGVTKKGKCYITKVPGLNLFVKSQLTDEHVEQLITKFPKVFKKELGLCTKTEVKLHLVPGIKPTYIQKRLVSYAALPKIDAELQRLEKLNIIEKIDFSLWAAPIVAVNKPNGKIRLCADYSTGLNAALQPNKHPLPLPDDIFAKLAGNKCFTVIDFSDAYFQLAVNEDSQELLTINTHRGLFKFKRLPFGVKSAPGAFQQIVDAMIADMPFVSAYLDDIIICSKTATEHMDHLTKLIQRIEDYGFALSSDKCQFFTKQVKFLGHIIDEQGLQPDLDKINCIRKMPPPNNISELRAFLGAINYYGKFVYKMQQLRGPLDQLLRKDTAWNWSPRYQQAFEQLKEVLQMAADACNTGIGAVIFHEYPNGSRKAIYHSSRTLTEVERNYSQIEKEALALIFAVIKFHKLIFGKKFILETDHKPLLHIFGNKKGIPVYTANRLQRWACTLLLYDCEIRYISTDSFGYADFLSRLINSRAQPDEESIIAVTHMEATVKQIQQESIKALTVTFEDIQHGTKNDLILQSVINYLNHGWPSNKKDITEDIQPYHIRRNELLMVNGSLMLGERVIIPPELRNKVLRQIHKGHPGMEKTKAIARSYVY
ncbi:PREDICTED: uncharacterized protein K02A2.6-like [Cyphomyrmex costatus]|uniref:uncharacterized protein K02A2.6-like n=1 Tax=Cyphomyrmex costatus TaxID=456900 RepID=UPI000852387A|nr:PREDICTED: uncharacterized protein K02A2.6-like [Cyphomyrmex costatus]